ncbi:hypothetical protein [Candidatus Thiodiazotropha sp. CDECU1]|uniref:hypothetical protein n=1 Tax=Candidatus Thiodiazotropha sp. CDECU1 TaxID=3065865 RepID=UPI00292E356A|nr:hypothetical protein [Candidatus Thiodiazotropha sp. CDECU1]
MNIVKKLSVLTFLVTMTGACSAFDISGVEDPPDSTVIYVGDVVQNGLPIQMKQFDTTGSPGEVIGFYKQRWSDTRNYKENIPQYIEKKVGDWWVLSKMEGNHSVVVQVQETTGNHSTGFISVSDISSPQKVSDEAVNFPRMNDSELLSSTESIDNGKYATTIILINNHTIIDNSEYYKTSMSNSGWVYTNSKFNEDVSTMYFSKKSQHCEIAIAQADDGKTVIFANVVESKQGE